MTALLNPAASPADPLPRSKRWTCEEYHRLGGHGVFAGTRTFLIDGEIYEMAPGDPPHASSTNHAADVLSKAFGSGFAVRVQSPLVLGLSTDPEPDLAVVTGSHLDYVARHPTTAVLVVEVSDSSRRFDLTDKASLYAAAGIADYWVVDLVSRRMVVHRDPCPEPAERFGHGYGTVTSHAPGGSVVPLAGRQPVAVSELLP